ncbi:hypothetical protein K502DRAFT_344137 [Neoconidiobolus thromboides FSU 785]|nr:hypothetical protein K502DRAFT_344137 [Neoconidiobolus thromboides FSU 785]
MSNMVENSLLIHTPNLLSTAQNAVLTGTLKKVSEELVESLELVLKEANVEDANSPLIKLELPKTSEFDTLLENDLEVSAKIFFLDSNEEPKECYVSEAVDVVLKTLNIKRLDSLFVAFNGLYLQEDEDIELKNFNNELVSKIWKRMEAQVEDGKVNTLGISEFSKKLLKELYDNSKIKPVANQINLTDCCVIPKDLREYAKETNIKLYTHIDPSDLISQQNFDKIVSNSPLQTKKYTPKWAIRYTIMFKARGIAASKGYIIKATSLN